VFTANNLAALPPLQNPDLRILEADTNRITTIPGSIGQCTALERLSLVHNQISSVPAEIGKCHNLTVLNLRANRITSLPVAELAKLPSLLAIQIANEPPKPNPDGTVDGETDQSPTGKKP
jgi:leucine-rich repeat protein SHOC2